MTCSKDDPLSIEITAESLRAGEISIIPTDTVYGFSGIAGLKENDPFGCEQRIASIKGRPEGKPMIHLIARPEDIFLYTDAEIPSSLLEKWPGALSVIVPVKKDCPLAVSGSTVAFRCPGDQWLRQVIEKTGFPIYSTSVNRSGFPVLARASEIKSEFLGEVDLFVDDGDKINALPSTIVSVVKGSIEIIRQGGVKV